MRHEHLIPRNDLKKRISEIKNSGNKNYKDEIYNLLTNYCLAVIVTKDENDLLNKEHLPSDFWELSNKNLLTRYMSSNSRNKIQINVIDLDSNCELRSLINDRKTAKLRKKI